MLSYKSNKNKSNRSSLYSLLKNVLMIGLVGAAPFTLSSSTAISADGKTPPVLFNVTLNGEFGNAKATFDAAKDIILKNYYNSTLNEDILYYAAIKGMLRHISPPHMPEHSKLLLPEQFNQIKQALEGKTVSIGISGQLDPRDGGYSIEEVVPGSPADGVLEVFDRILRIDGEALKGKTQAEADQLITGEEGTKVMLTVIRDIQVFDLQLERKEFKVPNMKVYELKDNIYVIEMQKMTADISQELKAELEKLQKKSVKKHLQNMVSEGCWLGRTMGAQSKRSMMPFQGNSIVRICLVKNGMGQRG